MLVHKIDHGGKISRRAHGGAHDGPLLEEECGGLDLGPGACSATVEDYTTAIGENSAYKGVIHGDM